MYICIYKLYVLNPAPDPTPQASEIEQTGAQLLSTRERCGLLAAEAKRREHAEAKMRATLEVQTNNKAPRVIPG